MQTNRFLTASQKRDSDEANSPGRHSQRTPTLRSPGRLLFLVLVFTVFAWGTSYKLSLYKISPPGNAPVKLCKLASDNAKSELDLVLDGHKTAAVASLAGLVVIPEPADFANAGHAIPQHVRGKPAPLRFEPFLNVRPPPLRARCLSS